MSRESLVFIFGFLVFVVPFLGLPRDYKDIFLYIVGVFLMLIGFILRRAAYLRSIERESGERHADAFAESVVTESVSREMLPERELAKEI